jgi:hypothetical protein
LEKIRTQTLCCVIFRAEAVMAGLSVANVAETEHALSIPLSNVDAIYKANLDMKRLHQEVARVVLLDGQMRCITKVDISRGTVNESFAAPRDIFRPAIDVPEGLAHTGFFIRTSGVIKDARDTFEVVDAGVNQQADLVD